MCIRDSVVGEEADYVAKANQSEDVRLLASQINQQLKEALESDALLAGSQRKKWEADDLHISYC